MLRHETSTGGTDLLAQFIISRLTNYNVGILIFIINGIVILCGSWIVGLDIFLYSVVVVTVVGAVTTMLTSINRKVGRIFTLIGGSQGRICLVSCRGYYRVNLKTRFSYAKKIEFLKLEGTEQNSFFSLIYSRQFLDVKAILSSALT
jgi:Uncharacterised 5xTM membrane BCR, YitT family COG1284